MQIEGLAGRGRRLAAVILDAILVPLVAALLIMMTDVIEDAEDFVDNWWMLHVLLLAIAAYLALNGFTLWRYGQTLGKRLLGIAVIDTVSELPDEATPASAPRYCWSRARKSPSRLRWALVQKNDFPSMRTVRAASVISREARGPNSPPRSSAP